MQRGEHTWEASTSRGRGNWSRARIRIRAGLGRRRGAPLPPAEANSSERATDRPLAAPTANPGVRRVRSDGAACSKENLHGSASLMSGLQVLASASTGVRIFSPEGNSVAGPDLLPGSCGERRQLQASGIPDAENVLVGERRRALRRAGARDPGVTSRAAIGSSAFFAGSSTTERGKRAPSPRRISEAALFSQAAPLPLSAARARMPRISRGRYLRVAVCARERSE